MNFLKLTSAVGLFLFFVCGDVLYLKVLQLLKLSNRNVAFLDWAMELFCLMEVFPLMLINIIKLSQLSADSKFAAGTLREIASFGMDSLIQLHFLGFLKSWPHGIFGAFGVTTSVMGLWSTWPRLN